MFAVDSIPAIYATTDDPFIVFTRNIVAILGLRALSFVLAGYLAGLRYRKPALRTVLAFFGTKMILTVAIDASLIVARQSVESMSPELSS